MPTNQLIELLPRADRVRLLSICEPTQLVQGRASAVTDGATSEDGKYVYALDSGLGAITVLRIETDGTLSKIQTVTGQGIPTLGAEGLVAR